MIRIKTSFHNVAGSGIMFTSMQGNTFRIGETVGIYDDDTHTYLAEVIGVDENNDALILKVSDTILP